MAVTEQKDLANEPPSGRFVLRIDPDLHAVLRQSRRMAEIRTRIASGEMIRRWKDGHPYWVEVA